MSYFSTHNHTAYSNSKGLDSINRVEEILMYCHDVIKTEGICLTEHGVLSSHVEFVQAYKKLKESGRMRPNFKIGLGTEAYLCVEPTLEELKEKAANRETKFYHFLMIALNEQGHEQLRILSSQSWENSFMLYGQQRTPNLMSEFEDVIKKGDIVASSSCLGGYIPSMLLKAYNAESNEEKEKYKEDLEYFTDWCIKVFGEEYFFLEIQPSDNEEQILANKLLIKYAKHKGLKTTVATDSHYLKKEDRKIHKIYLQSQNAEREVDAFYDSCACLSEDEIKEYLTPHLSKEDIDAAFEGTMKIHEMVTFYDLYQPTIVPMPEIPEYTFEHKLKEYYGKYPYLKKFAYSEHVVDRFYLHLIQDGLFEKVLPRKGITEEEVEKYVARIEEEIKEIWLISEKMEQPISAYYVLTKEVIDIMWTTGDTTIGVSRGSAGNFVTNYLMGITQLDSVKYNLPSYRHISAERPEMPNLLGLQGELC